MTSIAAMTGSRRAIFRMTRGCVKVNNANHCFRSVTDMFQDEHHALADLVQGTARGGKCAIPILNCTDCLAGLYRV